MFNLFTVFRSPENRERSRIRQAQANLAVKELELRELMVEEKINYFLALPADEKLKLLEDQQTMDRNQANGTKSLPWS